VCRRRRRRRWSRRRFPVGETRREQQQQQQLWRRRGHNIARVQVSNGGRAPGAKNYVEQTSTSYRNTVYLFCSRRRRSAMVTHGYNGGIPIPLLWLAVVPPQRAHRGLRLSRWSVERGRAHAYWFFSAIWPAPIPGRTSTTHANSLRRVYRAITIINKRICYYASRHYWYYNRVIFLRISAIGNHYRFPPIIGIVFCSMV